MKGSPVRVEFLGLPGVGKSSVSHRVAEILVEKGLPVRQPTYTLDHGPSPLVRMIRKSWWVALESLGHPVYALASLRALQATGQHSTRILLKMMFNWLLVSALMRRGQQEHAIHLFDQGIFQALWSIGLGARDGAIDRVGRDLAGRFPAPTMVAVIEADVATIATRLGSRGGVDSRADAWNAADTQSFRLSMSLLEEAKGLLRSLSEPFKSIRTILVHNDHETDLESSAARLAGDIERIFRERLA